MTSTTTPLSELDIITKANVLLEALPYIQRFRNTTFVVKYGGAFMDDPDPVKRASVAVDLVFLAAVGINVVVAHGGGKAISRGMESSGLTPVFDNGLRVTDKATIEIVERVLNREVNLEICEMIQAKNGRPLGMPGNNIFVCNKLKKDEYGNPIDLGFVGDIEVVKTKLIKKAIVDGYMPIISPIAVDEQGNSYNTNADVAAACVASSLRARRLVYLCDVPGLLRDPKDPSSLISTLHVNEIEQLKKDGVITSGMLPKIHSAVRALENGVHRVHLVDARVPHSILLEIFTDKGIGTEIVNH